MPNAASALPSLRSLLAVAAALAVLLAVVAVPTARGQQAGVVDSGEFFLHGEPDDEANKAAGGPTATFTTTPVADDSEPAPVTQSTRPFVNADFAKNPLAAFWTGDFSGRLDGSFEITWFWSGAASSASTIPVEVTVFADPPAEGGVVEAEKIIGRATVPLTVGPTPVENVSVVGVTGTVAEQLTLQVRPIGVESDLLVSYDAESTPSRFVVSDVRPPPRNDAPAGIDGLEAADSQGLEFSASVPADLQRDEGEPLIEIDGDGKTYTCGPTGASQVNEYAQVSTDGGDQFHLLGEPPRGQISTAEGGGDCSISTAPEKAEGDEAFALTYSGLGPLTNFTTGGSTDGGRTILTSPVSESIPFVDRQWNTFLDARTVLLNYNNIGSGAPRQVVVQKSTDGGLTYGPRVPATPTSPLFPGPLRTLPAEFNPEGPEAGPVAYFPYSEFGGGIDLSISTDGGDTWQVCDAAESPGEPALFAVADHDDAGNIYITWSESATFHTYVTALTADKLGGCNEVVEELDAQQPTTNPGFSTPVQVDRGDVRSSVFAWVTADGAPGRVAVTFYGSESDGDPGSADFEGSWHVYVNQSVNALEDGATYSQVRATSHPNHYDQISLGGFSPTAPADRSLVDFFAIDYNDANGEVALVYNRAHKRPGDDLGLTSTPVVLHQTGGPSNGGGMLDSGEPPALRTSSSDPLEDAIADYSSLVTAPDSQNVPAADLTGHEVGPFVDLESGAVVEDGGFTATMSLDDLSDEALGEALQATDAQSLLWIFRFVDGFRYSAASARWNPADGFTFGFNDYVSTSDLACTVRDEEGSECLLYPGDTPIAGEVDQEAGTIRLSVPRELLLALDGQEPGGLYPEEVPAEPGDRINTAGAFSVSNTVSATQDLQSFLYPLDNTPHMDFLVPGGEPAPSPTDPPTEVPTEPPSGEDVRRVSGDGRLDTGVAVSREAFESADAAVLARADDFPDALAASALAAQLDAPVLLTPTGGLDGRVGEELERLGVTEAFLMGGTQALSGQVEADLDALDIPHTRIGGAERFQTAALIADEVVARGGPVDQAIVALGARPDDRDPWPDALAASNLAAAGRAPIILVTPDDVPDVSDAALERLLPDGGPVFIAGGTDAVGVQPEAELTTDGYDTTRLAGSDRYGTAVAIVDEAVRQGADRDPTLLANGTVFADALVAGPAAARLGGVLLLVAPDDLDDSPATREDLDEHADEIGTALIVGGTDAIAQRVFDQVAAIIGEPS